MVQDKEKTIVTQSQLKFVQDYSRQLNVNLKEMVGNGRVETNTEL